MFIQILKSREGKNFLLLRKKENTLLTLSMGTAIRASIIHEMKQNPNIFVMGQDITVQGGSNRILKNLYKIFGENRVIDTPVSENQLLGMATGAAMCGLVPIVEMLFSDFIGCAGDFIVNQIPKLRYMFNGQTSLPITLRLACGAGFQTAAQHSQSLEAFFVHLPGWKVAYPSNAEDAMGLLITAIKDDNPVVFFEHKKLYNLAGEIHKIYSEIPFGKGKILREGSEITIVATGYCVHKAIMAIEYFERKSIEIIDPRTLFPLDKELIYESIKKTHSVIIVTEETKRGAWSAELASCIVEDIFEYLYAPVIRVGALNTPIPFSEELEKYVLPSVENIIEAIKKMQKWRKEHGNK